MRSTATAILHNGLGLYAEASAAAQRVVDEMQEEHIARLARDRRTNSEIGEQHFLSVRTVEWHIGKVYTKLGITSRRELQSALARLDRR